MLGYEVDFLWPAARFVVEADGSDHLDPLQRDRDNTRDITLARAGYLVRRYSSLAMADEAAVVAEVLGILREREGLLQPTAILIPSFQTQFEEIRNGRRAGERR